MSISEKLDVISQSLSDIKTAITEKGQTPEGNISTYALAIKAIDITGVEINNQNKTVTSNGTYSADKGYTGLGEVTVNVPEKIFSSQEKTVTSNGVVTPDSGFDGLSKVTVDVPLTTLESKTITENGTYNAPAGVGYNSVDVNVPAPEIKLENKTITENGSYSASAGFDGLGNVSVDIPLTILEEKTVTSNGTYSAPEGYGYNKVNVNVPEKTFTTQEKTVAENGVVTPDSGFDGLSKVTVNVPSTGITPSGTFVIDTNGTYDITEYAEVEVTVPQDGGGGEGGEGGSLPADVVEFIQNRVLDDDFTFDGDTIGAGAFSYYQCYNMDFPNVTTVGKGAFNNVEVDSISLPNVTTLSERCFENATVNNSLELGEITEIPAGAFEGAYIPFSSFDSVTKIGRYAFRGTLYGMTDSTMYDNIAFPAVETIDKYAFLDNSDIQILDFPSLAGTSASNPGIGAGAFGGTINLDKIWIPSTCQYIAGVKGGQSPFNGSNEYVKIYTDATEKPAGWEQYWNYIGDGVYAEVIWGATHEDFESA